MSDFNHYAATAPRAGALRPFPLVCLPARPGHGPPTVLVEYLGQGVNKSWTRHLAMQANKQRKDGKVTEESIEEANARNREVVRDHCVRDLQDVFYADGRPATADDIGKFVAALPQCDIDDILAFAANHRNHRDLPASSPSDIAEKS